MLKSLSLVLHEAGLKSNREEALDLLLGWVIGALGANACALYRRSPDTGQLDLLAARGQMTGATTAPDLANICAEEIAPIRLEGPGRHPRYSLGDGDPLDPFGAYLGVPLIRFRKVVGVLEVRRRTDRPFDDEDASLLLTLSVQLAEMVAQRAPSSKPCQEEQGLFFGTAAAPGVAIGVVVSPLSFADLEAIPDRMAGDVDAEVSDFEDAVRTVQLELQSGSAEMAARLPEEVRALYGVYEMILGDASLVTEVIEGIRSGQWAPAALRDTVQVLASRFEAMDDAYLRARAEDIRAVGRRILLHLQYQPTEPGALPDRTVLLGKGVGLTCITRVRAERLVGLVCTGGSTLSHGVIIARALGIPAVVSVEGLRPEHCSGREVIVDGYRGRVILDPTPEVRAQFQRLQDEEAELDSRLGDLKDLAAQTPDGRCVALEANIGLLNEVSSAKDRGAEGVGLYRTEFPFLLRAHLPGESAQYDIYRELLEAFAPQPVTMRTLDAGGDKALPYLPLPEANPALGLRGIRLCLEHPEIFLIQLRALLRANAGLDNLRLLLPMVTLASEVEEARALLARAHASLLEEGQPAALPPVGIMLEVPAAVFGIEELVAGADFVSVGTNDLTQYVLAADRTNAHVETLCDPMTPAVLAAIGMAANGARTGKRDLAVSVCGELAGDPLGALLLLGLGVDALSMAPGNIPRVKSVIRSFSGNQARELWELALKQDGAEQVRKMLTEALEQKGLGGLIRPGK
jgi:phosphotransferase system enzyme I (PtsP)